METLGEHQYTLHYHPGKANVVADALSRKSWGEQVKVASKEWSMLAVLGEFRVSTSRGANRLVGSLLMQPLLVSQIIEAQQSDPKSQRMAVRGLDGWVCGTDGALRFRGRIYVPESMRERVLEEAHKSKFAVHPGSTKMYRNLHQWLWWRRMKVDVA